MLWRIKHGKRPHQEDTAFRRGEKENGYGEDVVFETGRMEKSVSGMCIKRKKQAKAWGRA